MSYFTPESPKKSQNFMAQGETIAPGEILSGGRTVIGKAALQVKEARAKFGAFPGTHLAPPWTGEVPRMPGLATWSLLSYWKAVGDDMVDQAVADYKKTLSSRAAQAASRVKPVVDQFKRDMLKLVGVRGTFFTSEEDTSSAAWTLVQRYAHSLSLEQWAGYHIETGFERALWAVKESAKELGQAIASPITGMLAAGDALWKMLKWGTLLTVALGGMYLASKVMKKKGTP